VAALWKQHTAGLRKALAQRDTLLHAYRSELASSIAALGQAAAQAKQIEHAAVAAVSVSKYPVSTAHHYCHVAPICSSVNSRFAKACCALARCCSATSRMRIH
jgi:hypothetical protein